MIFYWCHFRDIFGPNGQLIEIMNEEDQNLAVWVTKNLLLGCPINADCNFKWTYWWTGLQDLDDDTVWRWSRSKTQMMFTSI